MTNFNISARFQSSAGRLVLAICMGLNFFAATPVEARGTRAEETRIAECIQQAAAGRPWLEKTLWGLRDQEAGWLGAEVRNINGSHDLGPLQINSWWVPKIAALIDRPQADVRIWLTHDACFNAGAARWIFLSALKETGDFWKAVGVYHSPTVWRQRRYTMSVARQMQRRFGGRVFFQWNSGTGLPNAGVTSAEVARSKTTSEKTYGLGIQNKSSIVPEGVVNYFKIY